MRQLPRGGRGAWSVLFVSTAFIVVLVACSGCAGPYVPPEQSTPSAGSLTLLITQGQATAKVRVEVADTPEERAVGLSNRWQLGADQGMLFVFPEPGTAPFWMKDTYIPLSVAFIHTSGEILDIKNMEPLSEVLHYPDQPYQFALEVNQGFFESNDLRVGSTMTILDAQGQKHSLTSLVKPSP